MECVDALAGIVGSENRNGTDIQTVDFALISLGRIAGAAPGADGRGGCPGDVRGRALEKLQSAFGGRAPVRSFAALGLGLAGMDLDQAARTPVAEPIRSALERANGDVEQRGALCIALGLLRDVQSGGMLESLLQDRSLDKKLRGTAALGLGLIGDPRAADSVRAVLKEKEDRELRIDASVAASLLGDGKAVESLVEILEDPKPSQFVIGSAAISLGRIGDQRALEPLVRVLEDTRYPDLTRALSCVALGQIGDRNDVSVLSRMSRDVNYRAYFDAIGEVLTIF
jgi:HEAT repeat protein